MKKVNIDKHKYVLSVTTSLHRTYLLKAMNCKEYDKWWVCLSSQTKRLIFNQRKLSLSAATMTDEMEKVLIKLQDNNPYCADCGADNPQWVSINIGVIICVDCCSIHRSLGTHITKIRSLMLDNLELITLKYLIKIGGNKKLNQQLLEYNLSNTHKINYKNVNRKQRQNFIHCKYISKLYINDTNKNTDFDINEYLFQSVLNNNCYGVIFALINEANIDHVFEKYNGKTVLQQAILSNYDEITQLLLNNDATPMTQI